MTELLIERRISWLLRWVDMMSVVGGTNRYEFSIGIQWSPPTERPSEGGHAVWECTITPNHRRSDAVGTIQSVRFARWMPHDEYLQILRM